MNFLVEWWTGILHTGSASQPFDAKFEAEWPEKVR